MKKTWIGIVLTCMAIVGYAQNINFEWAKQMGGDYSDRGVAIDTDANGNAYVTGWFRGTVDFDPGTNVQDLTSAGVYDIFIQKLDAAGNLLWVKQIGGSQWNQGTGIATDAAGNVYVTGFFSQTADFDPGPGVQNLTSVGSLGAWDIFVLKLDTDGNYLWAKQMGGANGDSGTSIAVDAVGNVFTAGYFEGTGDFDPGPGAQNLTSAGEDDIFVQKMDTDGNFLWAKHIGASNNDTPNGVAIDNSGSVYITGYFFETVDFDPGSGVEELTSIGGDIFVQKMDSQGNFAWAKQIGGASNNDFGISYAIATDPNGGIYTTGDFSGTIDFDTGTGVLNFSSGYGNDSYVHKLDANGNFVWAKQIEGSTESIGFAIATDNSGSVYTTGSFEATADFDPGAGTFNLSSAGGGDIFIQKLDTNGDFLWAKQMGGANTDEARAIAVDDAENVYTTGFFWDTADFDPGTSVQNLTAVGESDIFVQKLGNPPVSINDYIENTSCIIYPNPFNNNFSIGFETILNDVEVTVLDVYGRLIQASKYQNTDYIELEVNKPAGVYYVEIKTPKDKKTVSLIKN